MAAHIDWVREFCRALPHTTEDVQWGALLFRIARKIYCTVPLEPESPIQITFKCTPEKFAELVETEGIIPAPYGAKNHWVAMTNSRALRQAEVKELIRSSYQMILEKLPKRTQAEMSGKPVVKTKTKSKTRKLETRRERRRK
jgi:predicted DNA-binding protein (MmcQ/YjbR family)